MTEPQAKIRKLAARVQLLERTEELLIIKRSEDDLKPLELTVNKRVRSIIALLSAL